jgi:tryptophanase
VEIGSLMFGGYDPVTGEEITAPKELVRLAVPRRVFTCSHLDYVADVISRITAHKERIRGIKIARQATYLRHFTVELEELSDSAVKVK